MHIRYWPGSWFRTMTLFAPTGAGSFREGKHMTNNRGFARRWLIVGVAAITTTAGLVVGVAGSASADPVTSLVGVGSDTTQDVVDAIADQIGGGLIGSWDAVNPSDHKTTHDLISPKRGCTMTRPNGSGEGVNALRISLGGTATPLADPPEPGCVDFARSSSGPASDTTGKLIYIPFALDAVGTATGPATATANAVATNIVDANAFTSAQIKSMYANGTTVTIGGNTYDPQHGAGNIPIDLIIPQAGSGTRTFWLQQMGITGAVPIWVHDTFTLNGASTSVEEHDGTVYATDANAFGPFSIAQWVSQRNGHNDRRHDAVLHNLDGIAPLTGGGSLNTAYPIKRNVFNVMSYCKVTGLECAAGDALVPSLKSTFSGTTSSTCGNAGNILSFGFALLSGAPLGFTCGQIAQTNRAIPVL